MLHLATAFALAALPSSSALPEGGDVESWRATLVVATDDDGAPSKELPFGLELVRNADGTQAFLLNPPERIPVPHVEWDGETLLLELPHYNSRIRATRGADGALSGEWTKVRGKDRIARVPFRAVPGGAGRFPSTAPSAATNVAGRWSVDFAEDEPLSVAILEQDAASALVTGTVLTATGDYRYLAGAVDGDTLRLSCFDGAHAFLFEARLADDGLAGEFYSGNWWLDTWTAKRDPAARLGDAFRQTTWDPRRSLADLAFPDLDGELVPLASPALAGKVTIVQLFGSWCPNCNDETVYLRELYERYAPRGLSILGLAFELTGERGPDTEQVRIFRERYDIDYPLFLAGTANKTDATLAFPAIDRLRSFPTTIFFDARGRVRSVHSGFAGPATGDAHAALRAQFEAEIEELLAEPAPDTADAWRLLTATEWSSTAAFAGATYAFADAPDGRRVARRTIQGSGVPVVDEQERDVTIVGDAVWVGGEVWRLDRTAGVLLDPTRFGRRLHATGGPTTPLIERRGTTRANILAGLRDDDALLRREALFALGSLERDGLTSALLTPHLDDADIDVRRAAAWAAGELRFDDLADELFALLEHPNAGLRREAVRALLRLSSRDEARRIKLAVAADDPDPIVRALLVEAELGR